MPIAFRPFEPERDFEVFARLWSLDNPDWPISEAELVRKENHRNPEHPVSRWVGEREGRAVCGFGYGDQDWAHREGRKHLSWYFDPAHASEARPAIVAEAERRIREDRGDELNLWSRDDRSKTVEFLTSLGYRTIERQPVTRLDLRSFDAGPFQSVLDRVRSEGFRIVSVAQMDEEGIDWIPDHYEASWEMLQDIPMAQPPTRPDYDRFVKWLEDRKQYNRKLMFSVLEGERTVAYTRLAESDLDPGLQFTGLTGVRRGYRRRGLATAVKVYSLTMAKAMGAHTVQTDNLDINPMLDLNLRLGFRPIFAWLHFTKAFQPAA